MGDNIKYDQEKLNTALTEIDGMISQLTETTAEFDTIGEILSVSKGDEVDKLKEQLTVEKSAVLLVADFYSKLSKMIADAAGELDQTETAYGQEHVTSGGGA